MRKLSELSRSASIAEIKETLNNTTIFDKIEFSGISKETIKEKIRHLREEQVPNRSVFLESEPEEIVFYWFQNWLHPCLKHAVAKSPLYKEGCSANVLAMDQDRDMLNFYENGQQQYKYTLSDIENYINENK